MCWLTQPRALDVDEEWENSTDQFKNGKPLSLIGIMAAESRRRAVSQETREASRGNKIDDYLVNDTDARVYGGLLREEKADIDARLH
jgi:hypothetical protein